MTLPVGPALNNNYLINKRLSLRATGWADKSGYERPCGLSTAVLITYSAGGNRHSLLRRYLHIVLTISIKILACLIVNYYGADVEVTSGTDRKIKKLIQRLLLLLFVGCLTSQQHASVSQGRICSGNCTCHHTEIQVANQTF